MTVPAKRRAAILAAHEHTCHYCGRVDARVVDHIIPPSQGGSDLLSNLIAACTACNMAKSDRRLPPEEEQRAIAAAITVQARVDALVLEPGPFKRTTAIWPADLHAAISKYRFQHEHKSFSEAVLDLIRIGLAAKRGTRRNPA